MRFCILFAALACLLIFLPACKKKSNTVTSANSPDRTIAPPALLMSRDAWPMPFWTAKAKVSLKHPKMNVSFNMSLRSEKDKNLWFSAQAFGLLEVARGLITSDSLLIWDKFNNRCMVGSLNQLEEFVPVSMGLSQLQYFLMGRIFWDSLNAGKEIPIQDSLLLRGQNGSLNFEAKVWNKFLLHTAMARESQSKSQVYIENQQFKPASQMLIPWKKVLQAKTLNGNTEENSELEIEFSRFEFSNTAPDFTLNIPAGCQREVLK